MRLTQADGRLRAVQFMQLSMKAFEDRGALAIYLIVLGDLGVELAASILGALFAMPAKSTLAHLMICLRRTKEFE
jgi:hypothetical protein